MQCNKRPRREYLLEICLAEIEEKLTYTQTSKFGIVKQGKNGTNLTKLSITCYLLWPSLPHFVVLIHWSLALMNK